MALTSPYQVFHNSATGWWSVRRQYGRINGKPAWFIIASLDPADDDHDMKWSEGMVGTAEDRIRQIAAALNAMETARHLAPRIQFRVDAATERGSENIAIGVPLAREVVEVLTST